MYYTRARTGILDDICLATSPDGVRWKRQGSVLTPGPKGSWDALLVGRPSVLHDGRAYRMWYDGRASLDTPRGVGYAESSDGRTWTKHPANPLMPDAGAVDVRPYRGGYLMAYESTDGTYLCTSDDGIAWSPATLAVPRSGGGHDRHGHVTPMLLMTPGGEPEAIYLGVAPAPSWAENRIARVALAKAPTRPRPKPR